MCKVYIDIFVVDAIATFAEIFETGKTIQSD